MASKKGGVLSKVPLPDTFFSIKHELKPIASISVSAPSAILIYLFTLGGFVACWIFYSAPGPPQTFTVTQQEWQKEGYECKPLQEEPNYKVLYTYNECLSNFQEPSVNSVTQTSNSWVYKPIKGSTKALQEGGGKGGVVNAFGNSKCTGTNQSPVCAQSGSTGAECVQAQSAPTEQLCVTMFQTIMKDYTRESLCSVFKENAPFKCTKTEVSYKSELEKLSLSIANTQLLFGVLTAFFAFMFYKCKKSPTTAPDGKRGWQEAMQKLEETIDKRFSALNKKVDKTDKEMV